MKQNPGRDYITDTDIVEELNEICYREHNSCNSDCPVYKHLTVSNCEYHKNGKKMLELLKEKL